MDLQTIILAAGKGTRMHLDIPKVLAPLNGKPLISFLLNELTQLPQKTAPVIVVGFKEDLVKQALGTKYTYITQFDQKGTAHAVLSAKPVVSSETVVVLYGDMPFVTTASIIRLYNFHIKNKASISMFTAHLPNFEQEFAQFLNYGRIIRHPPDRIIKIQEYKDCSPEQQQITEVNPGVYIFQTNWLWENLTKINDNNAQHEYYLTDIIELAIQDSKTIFALEIDSVEIFGINIPEHLLFAQKMVKGGEWL